MQQNVRTVGTLENGGGEREEEEEEEGEGEEEGVRRKERWPHKSIKKNFHHSFTYDFFLLLSFSFHLTPSSSESTGQDKLEKWKSIV